MKSIATLIVNHTKLIMSVFILLVIITGLMIPLVRINYNMTDYIPEEAPSTISLHVMEEEFTQSVPNARILLEGVSIPEAKAIKDQLLALPEVNEVLWLDDVTDIYQPEHFMDQSMLGQYYRGEDALLQANVDLDDASHSIEVMRALLPENTAISGQVLELAGAQNSTMSEISVIIAFMVPISILLLVITTRNYLEPLVLLVGIGLAVVLNLGTNLLLGEVSFLTQAVAAILQLAVSLDYAIFLLHRYNNYREEGMDQKESMKLAITKSSVAITSSAMTTFLGFLVLIFMQFKIGKDLGIVLAKGIVFSVLSVLIFMPALILSLDKILKKAEHRSFLPKFKTLSKVVVKYHKVFLLIVIITLVSFLAQSRNTFLYSLGEYEEGSRAEKDTLLINEKFGEEHMMVLLVPRGDTVSEESLETELLADPAVSSIISYNQMVGPEIPEIMAGDQLRQFRSDKYSRIIISSETPVESEASFGLVQTIRERSKAYFGEHTYLVGQAPSVYDMKVVTNQDNRIVNGLAIATIGLVIMIAFKSISIPLILLFTIETSIWLNLSVPYFTGTPLNYIGYLIINAVQLGATVDYGILLTQHYMDNRRSMPKLEAMKTTLQEVIGSLLPPALILTLAGAILSIVSSIGVVSELGAVLGRGAFLSFIMVIFFLPALYLVLDPIVAKTTHQSNFFKKGDQDETNPTHTD